jgi:hypothetical protein
MKKLQLIKQSQQPLTVNASGFGQFIWHDAAPTVMFSCEYIRLLSLYEPTALMSDVLL